MTVGVPTFCGRRLTEARLARGLYKKSLGDMVGVSGTAIGRYEDGTDNPQQARLNTIAEVLNFPISFFSRNSWPEPIEPIFWRSQASESKIAREMTQQRIAWSCEIFDFLNLEVQFPTLNVPNLDLPKDFRLITSELVERAALQVRQHWGLRDRPIPDVTLALENAGIPVIHLDIPSEKQDGFFFNSKRLNRLFVGINASQITAVRARYDAAHELGHAILHGNVTPEENRDSSLNKQIEMQAHRFAGAFLFPKDPFLAEVRAPSLDYFCNLKRKWGISIAAMIYRAFNLGLIDDDERKTLYQNMTRRGWRGELREPYDRPGEMNIEKPRMLRRGVEAVVGGGIFGRDSFMTTLSLPEIELEQIIGLEHGYFRTAQVMQMPISSRRGDLRAIDLESGKVIEFPMRDKA